MWRSINAIKTNCRVCSTEQMTVAAIVFDMDGVLVDTEHVWNEIKQAFTDEVGGTWLDEAQHRMMGMSSLEWSQYMATELKIAMTPAQINDGVVERLLARYETELEPIPGAVDAVRRVSKDVPIAIASSSNRSIIDAVIARLGIADCFTVTVSSEEVAAGKPSPDVYLEATRRLGIDATQCAAVEDSSNGLRAAAAAGMYVVAYPNAQYPPTQEAVDLARLVLTSLDELNVDKLV